MPLERKFAVVQTNRFRLDRYFANESRRNGSLAMVLCVDDRRIGCAVDYGDVPKSQFAADKIECVSPGESKKSIAADRNRPDLDPASRPVDASDEDGAAAPRAATESNNPGRSAVVYAADDVGPLVRFRRGTGAGHRSHP
jgi:hypothetical protein